MKKDILIFRSKVPDVQRSTAYRLEQGLQSKGLDNYSQVYYSDLIVQLSGRDVKCFYVSSEKLLPLEADLVYLHGFSAPDIRQFIAQYLSLKRIKFINSENLYNMPTSKLNQYFVFSQNKVPYPATVAVCPPYFDQALELNSFNFPLVVKSVNAKRGQDNYLVKSKDELQALAKKLDAAQHFALQPFIENDGDYRFIVFKRIVASCYKRSRSQGSTDHRNNVSQGGKRSLVTKIPRQHRSIAIRAAKVLRRELTGIDLIVGPDNKPYVLESNFNFGLKDESDGIYQHVLDKLAPLIHRL